MRALVVYYSRTGHTRTIAEAITKELQCDSEEIIDTIKRSGPLGFIAAGRQATKKELTKLMPVKKDPSAYDLVIIGSPVWAGTMSTPVRTYIVENKDKFKNVALFITCGGVGESSALREMAELYGKTAQGTLAINTTAMKEGVHMDSLKQFIGIIKSTQ
jgi:flavodoxin